MPRESPPARRPPLPKGLICPVCGPGAGWRLAKMEKRPGGRVVRRRECRTCGKRVTTVEIIQHPG